MDRTERALRLLEEIEELADFEEGLIDPSDYDRFSCADLLRVANGEARLSETLFGTVQERNDKKALEEWNQRARQQGGQ